MHLGKTLCSSRWKHIWDGLGGTAGLLNIFADLSVHDVRTACKLLAKSGRGKHALEKRPYITELFMGLQPNMFLDAPFKTTDRRPLAKFYRHLIPACTEELVERILLGDLKGKWKATRDELLMQCHPDILRKEQLAALKGESGATLNATRLKGLVNQYPTEKRNSSFSQSMEFSLQVLRVVVEKDESVLNDYIFIDDLVQPLLRRAIKKQIDWSKTQEIVDLTMQYLEKHPHAGSAISTTVGDVHHLVALCWAYEPERFDAQLRKLCSDPRFGTSKYSYPNDWTDFLSGVPKKRKYALLRLCLQESTGWDIDSAEDLRKAQLNLSYELLERLSAQEALDLFTRFRGARDDNNLMLISLYDSLLGIGPALRKSGRDNDMFYVFLLHRNGSNEDAQRLARHRIEVRKKEAAAGKEPEHRTFYAKSALYYAIASGDVHLYQEVLRWTKRFSRDPLVYRDLYAECYTREAYTLLAGVSDASNPSTKSEVQARVRSGNAVLQALFDTACEAIREPSFQSYDWNPTLAIFQRVLQERIDFSAKLKAQLKASDDEMYTILWEDTIEMLLAVEEKAHWSENNRLEATSPRGPFEYGGTGRCKLTITEPSTYRFLDNLAQARDSFWGKLRKSRHPAVLVLPKLFPRGLPIQYLTGVWFLNAPKLEEFAPYLASRTKATLFPEPSEALAPVPDDEESMAAFGHFVESYKHALRLYIPDGFSTSGRTKRVSEVWSYAIGPLSSSRMSEEEAARYFQDARPNYLRKEWPPSPQPDVAQSNWPLLPEVDDPAQCHEWNPFNAGRPDNPARDIAKPTYLDYTLLLDRGQRWPTPDVWSKWAFSATPKIPANEVGLEQIWSSSRNMGEGGVLSALLYLEMMYGATHGSLLEKPFPSADDARYPSLYLDGDFQGEPLNCYNAVRHIHGQIDSIPPTLLHLSARNMIAELAASDRGDHRDSSVQELALTLLLRLGESDTPVLAQDMAINIILNRPTASSWHRLLMKPSYLRRMSASDARACFKTLAEAILQRMLTNKEDHKRLKDDTPRQVIEAAPSTPVIKVTTSKFLAQLLNGTEFIDEESSFAILSTLLGMDVHIDVRTRVTQSLLAMLDVSSPELAEKVFTTLESLIPMAGNLHELKPAGESEWSTSEKTLSLPAFPDIDDQSPTGKLFIDYYSNASNNSEYRQAFLDRILLPTIKHRQDQVTRWNSLFLKKYGVDEASLQVPVMVPYATQLLQKDFAPHLPATLLNDVISHTLFTLAPPGSISDLHTKLKADPDTMSRPEVFPWFQMYGGGVNALLLFRRFDMLSLLDKCAEDSAITPVLIKTKFFEVFKVAIIADAPLYTHLSTTLLHNFVNGTYLTCPWWHAHGKPLLAQMIEYVESMRTPAWLNDVNRVPSVLPETFSWRLLLLDFPLPSPTSSVPISSSSERQNEVQTFANQITSIVEHDLGTDHNKLDHLKSYLALHPSPSSSSPTLQTRKHIGNRHFVHDRKNPVYTHLETIRLLTATYLGSLKIPHVHVGAADMLKVEVARYLLGLVQDEWKNVDKGVKEGVRGMVEGWRGSADEGVRRVGWGCEWVFK
jgi:hypothetical protein